MILVTYVDLTQADKENMISGLGASVSGLWVFVRKLENAARNIASSNTDGYKARRATVLEGKDGLPEVHISVDTASGALLQDSDGTTRETSNVEVPEEMADLLLVKRGYEANLKSMKTQDEMYDSLLDITV